MVDLGQITNRQRMNGVRFTARDVNGNQVPNFNPLELSTDQANVVAFENIAAAPDTPAGSVWTADIKGLNPSSGQVTITAKGQQGNFMPHFTTLFTLTVIQDPSIPGPPTSWDVAPGTVVAQ